MLYLCVFDRPQSGKITLETGLNGRNVAMLSDGKPLKFSSRKGITEIDLPETLSDSIATVIKLELKGKLPQEKLISNSEKVFKIVDAD